MNIILSLFLFISIVLLYLNMMEQYRVGSELEIYELDYDNNFALQRILKKKQPVMFQMKGVVLPDAHNIHDLALDKYATKYGKERVFIAEPTTLNNPVALSLDKALELLTVDTAVPYLSYKNSDFVQETSMSRYMASVDEFLQPSFTVKTQYDFIFGTHGAKTPTVKHDAHSAFLYVSRGEITVKMTPMKNHKYFTSTSHLWSPNADVPSLEFQVPEGWALYVPPFWFYSYRLDKEKTLVHDYKYTTVMNLVAKIPNYVKQWIDPNNNKEKEKEKDTEMVFQTVEDTSYQHIPLSKDDASVQQLEKQQMEKQELDDYAQKLQEQKEKHQVKKSLENKPLQPPVIGAQQHAISTYEQQYDMATPISPPATQAIQEVMQGQIQTDAADFTRKL